MDSNSSITGKSEISGESPETPMLIRKIEKADIMREFERSTAIVKNSANSIISATSNSEISTGLLKLGDLVDDARARIQTMPESITKVSEIENICKRVRKLVNDAKNLTPPFKTTAEYRQTLRNEYARVVSYVEQALAPSTSIKKKKPKKKKNNSPQPIEKKLPTHKGADNHDSSKDKNDIDVLIGILEFAAEYGMETGDALKVQIREHLINTLNATFDPFLMHLTTHEDWSGQISSSSVDSLKHLYNATRNSIVSQVAEWNVESLEDLRQILSRISSGSHKSVSLHPRFIEAFDRMIVEELQNESVSVESPQKLLASILVKHDARPFKSIEDILLVLLWERIDLGEEFAMQEYEAEWLDQQISRRQKRKWKDIVQDEIQLEEIARDLNNKKHGGYDLRDTEFIYDYISEQLNIEDESSATKKDVGSQYSADAKPVQDAVVIEQPLVEQPINKEVEPEEVAPVTVEIRSDELSQVEIFFGRIMDAGKEFTEDIAHAILRGLNAARKKADLPLLERQHLTPKIDELLADDASKKEVVPTVDWQAVEDYVENRIDDFFKMETFSQRTQMFVYTCGMHCRKEYGADVFDGNCLEKLRIMILGVAERRALKELATGIIKRHIHQDASTINKILISRVSQMVYTKDEKIWDFRGSFNYAFTNFFKEAMESGAVDEHLADYVSKRLLGQSAPFISANKTIRLLTISPTWFEVDEDEDEEVKIEKPQEPVIKEEPIKIEEEITPEPADILSVTRSSEHMSPADKYVLEFEKDIRSQLSDCLHSTDQDISAFRKDIDNIQGQLEELQQLLESGQQEFEKAITYCTKGAVLALAMLGSDTDAALAEQSQKRLESNIKKLEAFEELSKRIQNLWNEMRNLKQHVEDKIHGPEKKRILLSRMQMLNLPLPIDLLSSETLTLLGEDPLAHKWSEYSQQVQQMALDVDDLWDSHMSIIEDDEIRSEKSIQTYIDKAHEMLEQFKSGERKKKKAPKRGKRGRKKSADKTPAPKRAPLKIEHVEIGELNKMQIDLLRILTAQIADGDLRTQGYGATAKRVKDYYWKAAYGSDAPTKQLIEAHLSAENVALDLTTDTSIKRPNKVLRNEDALIVMYKFNGRHIMYLPTFKAYQYIDDNNLHLPEAVLQELRAARTEAQESAAKFRTQMKKKKKI